MSFSLPFLFKIFTIFLSFLQMVTRTKKIFVGGLSAPSTLEDVKNYFEQFGAVSTTHFLSKKTTAWTVKSVTSTTTVQYKDREGLRLFAESKALMTCFDLTNFLFWPSLPCKTRFSAESVLIYKKFVKSSC